MWLWTLLALTACSTCIGTVFVSAATVAGSIPRTGNEAMALELQSLVSVLMSFIGLTACAVIATNTRLVIVTQARTHALWKVVGMPASTVRRVVLGQVTVLGVLAGGLACVLSPFASLLYIHTWAETGLPVTGHLGYSASVPVSTIVITTVFALIGVWGPSKTAARTDELATVIDAHSRRVVGWAIADHMRTDLVEDALRMAITLRGELPAEVVFHTDRLNSSSTPQSKSPHSPPRTASPGRWATPGSVGTASIVTAPPPGV